MHFLGVHHIRFAVGDPSSFSNYLIKRFKFQYYAHRSGSEAVQPAIVLNHNGVVFIVDQRNSEGAVLEKNENMKYTFCGSNASYPVDTVCDACFQCNNIDEIIKRVKISGKGSCLDRSKITDDNGTVSYALLQSPFGNVQHTLVDLSEYNGQFLPGYELNKIHNPPCENYLSCVDHLAYMVPTGEADGAIEWYNFVFGFERLFINRDDLVEEGYLVKSGLMGMKLKAIHGIGLCANSDNSDEKFAHLAPVKFVFGEPLQSSESDQISTFLEQHRGAGIQHLGLGTHSILKAVNHFKELGASFVAPPIDYYSSMESLKEIHDLDVSPEDIVKSGILVESSHNSQPNEVSLPAEQEPWYIMQVFTKNLFKEQTFFLELIQRHRTEGGFGAGNIKALWEGVQAHIAKLNDTGQKSVSR